MRGYYITMFILVMIVLILSAMFFKWIWSSDLPTWLKWFILK